MGSSMVTTWSRRLVLIRSISAAKVELLPQPVGPVIRTSPLFLELRQSLAGQPEHGPLLQRHGPEFSVEIDGGRVPVEHAPLHPCLLYTSPSPRDRQKSR